MDSLWHYGHISEKVYELSSYFNIFKIFFAAILILIVLAGHNFAHVMSWHMQNCVLVGSLLLNFRSNCPTYDIVQIPNSMEI